MRSLLRLAYWDLVLLHRNQLLVLSAVLAGVYMGLFYLLRELVPLSDLLVVLLFNDPVVAGFMFAGLLLLFDKSQQTLSAVQVSPLPAGYVLLSRALVLTAVSTGTALVMTAAVRRSDFQPLHLVAGVAGTTLVFVFAGFYFGSRARSFNHFLLSAIGFLLVLALAFLPYFHLLPEVPFLLLPSFAGLKLLRASLVPVPAGELVYGYLYLAFSVWLSYSVALRQYLKTTT